MVVDVVVVEMFVNGCLLLNLKLNIRNYESLSPFRLSPFTSKISPQKRIFARK